MNTDRVKETYRQALIRISESDCDCAVGLVAKQALEDGRDIDDALVAGQSAAFDRSLEQAKDALGVLGTGKLGKRG